MPCPAARRRRTCAASTCRAWPAAWTTSGIPLWSSRTGQGASPRPRGPAAPCVAAADFASVLPVWLAPPGPLGPLVADIDRHDFLDADTLERLRARPDGLLFTLLAFDLWHKRFVDGRPPRPPEAGGLAGVSPLNAPAHGG